MTAKTAEVIPLHGRKAAKKQGAKRELPIQTTYYFGNDVVKINKALHANSAVPLCIKHMQLNHYEATVAEVYDTTNGKLHAVIKRGITSADGKTKDKIEIVFQRKVKEGM